VVAMYLDKTITHQNGPTQKKGRWPLKVQDACIRRQHEFSW